VVGKVKPVVGTCESVLGLAVLIVMVGVRLGVWVGVEVEVGLRVRTGVGVKVEVGVRVGILVGWADEEAVNPGLSWAAKTTKLFVMLSFNPVFGLRKLIVRLCCPGDRDWGELQRQFPLESL